MDRQVLLYRAYHLRADGHFLRAEIVSAAGDQDAMEQVAAMSNGHGIEVWDRGRFIGKAVPTPRPDLTIPAEL